MVFVDPAVTTLFPLNDVCAVIYDGWKQERRVLEGKSGLYLMMKMPISVAEEDLYKGFAATAPRRPVIAAVSTPNPVLKQPEVPMPQSYGGNLILLALLAFSAWPASPDQMPLAFLTPFDETKWIEATCRLQSMGMIEETRNPGMPQRTTQLGKSFVEWLPFVTEGRVACFLAHIDARSSNLEARVIIWLAVIIEYEVPIAALGCMSRRVIQEVRQAACGPAPCMVDHGELWVALSLWNSWQRGNGAADEPAGVFFDDGGVILQHPEDIHDRVLAL